MNSSIKGVVTRYLFCSKTLQLNSLLTLHPQPRTKAAPGLGLENFKMNDWFKYSLFEDLQVVTQVLLPNPCSISGRKTKTPIRHDDEDFFDYLTKVTPMRIPYPAA